MRTMRLNSSSPAPDVDKKPVVIAYLYDVMLFWNSLRSPAVVSNKRSPPLSVWIKERVFFLASLLLAVRTIRESKTLLVPETLEELPMILSL